MRMHAKKRVQRNGSLNNALPRCGARDAHLPTPDALDVEYCNIRLGGSCLALRDWGIHAPHPKRH